MKKIILFIFIICSFWACKKFIKLTPITEVNWLSPKDSLLVGSKDTLQLSVATGNPNNSVNLTFLFLINKQVEKADELLFSVSDPSSATIQTIDEQLILKTFKTGTVIITAYAKSNPNVSNTYRLIIYDQDILIQDNNLRKALFNNAIAIDVNTGITKLSIALFDTGILNMSSQNITSLSGLENFKNLKGLDCSNNNISDISVIKNMTNITTLDCSQNPQITNLNIEENKKLQTLICSNNNLSLFNLSQNTALIKLICNNNQLSTLDISNNPNLQIVDCSNNLLSSLSVTNNPRLSNLNCAQNNNMSVSLTTAQYNKYVASTPALFLGANTWRF